MVLSSDTGQVIGDIANTPGVHSVALAPELGRGFTSNGGSNSVTIFDLKSLHSITTIHVPGTNPDGLAFDPKSQLLFVMNRGSQSIDAIRSTDGTLVSTIALVDNPASAVADGQGRLYVVLADPAEIAVIDTVKISLLERIPLAPCIEPRGVALNLKTHRLFAGCSNGLLVVVDPSSRRIVGKVQIDENAGDVALDAVAQFVFTASARGTLSVVRENFPDKYAVIDTIRTARGSSSVAVDVESHKVFIPTGRLQSRATSQPPFLIPRSCLLLVLGKI